MILNSLSDAILNKQKIQFTYRGWIREVEPFTLGIYGTTGNYLLIAYQFAGGSSTGTAPAWKRFNVCEIERLSVLAQRFLVPRLGYNPYDRSFSFVFAKAIF